MDKSIAQVEKYTYTWYRNQEQKTKKAVRQRKWGISQEEFDALCAKQNGKCTLCGELPGKLGLVVDHDHKTGKARGLLCNRCNSGLGFLRDDPTLLRNAANYIETAILSVATNIFLPKHRH